MQQQLPNPGHGYDDTPLLPGDEWRVHDKNRPQPPVVHPATPSTQEQPGEPPSDAIVLFDGTDLSAWRDGTGNASQWTIEDGAMQVKPGNGDIYSQQEFGDMQLHIEWAAPAEVRGESQGRGNSGVFLAGLYEIQVLDSYENPTYADGLAASVYGQYPPLVNAMRPPGEWQIYDIIFTMPRFNGGAVETPAYVTVIHNGVVVQNHTAIIGGGTHRQLPEYSPHGAGPLRLQDHGDLVRFRNIWIRPLNELHE